MTAAAPGGSSMAGEPVNAAASPGSRAGRASWQGHLAMLLFSVLVAGSFSLGARSAPLIPPEVMTALRFPIAALILLIFALRRGGLQRKNFAAPWRYLLLGAAMAAYFVLMFEGLRTAAALSTSAVFTLTPLLAAGFGWLLMRQRMTGRMALAFALGVPGALWVVFDADLAALLRLEIGRGELIYFIGCISHAFYAALVPKLNRGESALTFTCGTMIAGSLILFVWSAPALITLDWTGVPGFVWLTLGYIALASTAISTLLVQYAALRLPAAKVMAYSWMVPVWVIPWELALGAPPPPAGVAAGILLTMIALALLLKDGTGTKAAPRG